MYKLQILINRNEKQEYRKVYYQNNKNKWITYRQNRLQKLKDLRPAIIFY